MHEWMGDNSHTPHIVVDVSVDGVNVPIEHAKDGKIILNISESAAHNLKLTNDAVSFRARFGGVVQALFVPMTAVLAIYSRENGRGMMFPELESEDVGGSATSSTPTPEDADKRTHLRIVK